MDQLFFMLKNSAEIQPSNPILNISNRDILYFSLACLSLYSFQIVFFLYAVITSVWPNNARSIWLSTSLITC